MSSRETVTVRVIDSHTGGEPTRIVIHGGPELSGDTLAEKRDDFRSRYDGFRSAVVCEPRGSDVLIGGLLVEPADPSCAAGVIFFNNVGYLGMCGHGTIGLIVTLAHLGRIGPGAHRIETPVGIVMARLHEDGFVSVENVPAYRHRKAAAVAVDGAGTLTGDIAWGGNWFFLCHDHGQTVAPANLPALTDLSWRIRHALKKADITGRDGAEIDHIELFAPSPTPGVDGRSFVLCPGGAYDRSPCGTGTSAKLACLIADSDLAPGALWRQESVIGSVFEGRAVPVGDGSDSVLPTIRGTAFVTGEATLILDPRDPFREGIVLR